MTTEKTVLLVDDEEDMLTCVGALFRRRGFRVLVARDGLEALQKVAEAQDLALVVLDVMLPRLDGYSVLLQLRRDLGVEVPVIMLTAKGGQQSARDGYLQGADFYISKPFEAETLLNAAEYCVSGCRGPFWPSTPETAQPFEALNPPHPGTLPRFGYREDGALRHILLIDDDEDGRNAVARLLKARGFTSQQAQNAYEAMDLIKAGTCFGLILLDHSMPGKTGLDFLGWLRRRPAEHPPVVMISGHSTGSVIQRAYAEGVQLILAKPVTIECLDIVLAYYFSDLAAEKREALRARMFRMVEGMA